MKVWTLPVVAAMVMVATYSDSNEPNERQMRQAFSATLSAQVSGALDAVAEIGGPAALEQVRARGSDRFEIRRFHKLGCSPLGPSGSYHCAFEVDVEVMNGTLRRTLDGAFARDSGGLVFTSAAI